MKKRFTIMLEQRVIDKIKQLYGYWTPSGVRESIQEELEAWAEYQLDDLFAQDWHEHERKYNFDDK